MRINPGLTAIAAALLAGLPACAEKEPAAPQVIVPPRELTVDEATVASASNVFGLKLLQRVHGAETEPNVFLSPLSVSMALGMALNGAAGQTHEAMARTLGFEGMAEPAINAAYRGLIDQLRARDPEVEFRLANSVWSERTFAVREPFLEAARTHFDAEVRSLDFRAPDAPAIISEWAEQATGGRIKDLIERIDPDEVMFLVNAVYFKAPWTRTFEPNATRDAPFKRLDGSRVDVPMMMADGSFLHYMGSDVHAVDLLYADSAFSMTVLVPAGDGSLDALIAGLTPERWRAITSNFTAGRIILRMPKFTFEYGVKLNDALKALGMDIAFRPGVADFSRIAPPPPELYISRVEHKTFIDVHERGTEAAAATSVGIRVTSLPPELRIDRPFLFAIRERSTGTVLFIGRVGDPAAE